PPRPESHNDGESIEDYMSQLLQRMRTPKAGESTAPPIAPLLSQAGPAPVVPPVAATETKGPRPMPLERAPRLPPPELSADFSAMRALANNTARQAIDTHRRRGLVRSTKGNLLVAATAL